MIVLVVKYLPGIQGVTSNKKLDKWNTTSKANNVLYGD